MTVHPFHRLFSKIIFLDRPIRVIRIHRPSHYHLCLLRPTLGYDLSLNYSTPSTIVVSSQFRCYRYLGMARQSLSSGIKVQIKVLPINPNIVSTDNNNMLHQMLVDSPSQMKQWLKTFEQAKSSRSSKEWGIKIECDKVIWDRLVTIKWTAATMPKSCRKVTCNPSIWQKMM